MSKVKICGLTGEQDIECVNKLMPDYIGFVFGESKRQVFVEQAQRLKAKLNPNIKAVGVFVNAPLEKVAELAEQGIIDIVQLHGEESVEYCQKLKEKINVPLIKALPLREDGELKNLAAYSCDYFLFDAYAPGTYGGSGILANVALLEKLDIKKPFFLAGGLNPQNVCDLVKRVKPFGVDVSTGVETAGVKDEEKIKAFLKIVRAVSK